jgi:predicted nucleotidyltransferase
VVSLYIDDLSADGVRPTKDLDLTMEIASLGELESLREALIERGFVQSAMDSVVCRFRYDDVLVDVMATVQIGWAPGNRWFERGIDLAFTYDLDDLKIRLLPLPYFLAAKFDAFFDRGIQDQFASHDFEDIVYLFNYSSDKSEQVLNSRREVKSYLMGCASKIIESRSLKEAIVGNLYYEGQDESFNLIIKKLTNIAHGI